MAWNTINILCPLICGTCGSDQFSCPLTCEPCCIEGYKYSAVNVCYPVGHVAEENGQFLPEIWNFINHRAHDTRCSLVETVYTVQ